MSEKTTIKEGVAEIGDGGTLLISVPRNTKGSFVIPNGITKIGARAFYNCNVSEVIIPDTVTSIGSTAFYECKSLKRIVIPKSVTEFGAELFAHCSSLKSVVIEGEDVAIKNYMFFCCHKLTNVSIRNATKLGEEAFASCTSLKRINIPEGIKIIERSAFNGCSSLKHLTFPQSLEKIDFHAFKDCASLKEVIIPKNVSRIYYAAFAGCNSLEKIIVDTDNNTYHSKGNCLIETANKKLVVGCKNSKIPSNGSVMCIGKYAFKDYSSVTSISLPACIAKIEDLAFFGCYNLGRVFIPASVTEIGKEIAMECVPTFTFYCEKEQGKGWDEKWNKVNPKAFKSVARTQYNVPRWWYGKFVI